MSTAGLISVLLESRDLIERADNDFSWSGWTDADEARREVDGIIDVLRSGGTPDLLELKVLFAPSGPLQELSLSSGWAREFLALAQRFDRELERLGQGPS